MTDYSDMRRAFERVLDAKRADDLSNDDLLIAAEYTRACQFSLCTYVLRLTKWLIQARLERDALEHQIQEGG